MPTVTGTPTQAGYDALASAVIQSTGTPTFVGIRIKDSGGAVIRSQTADFTSTPVGGGGTGVVIEGTTVFSAANVTSDVHSAEMYGPSGDALVTAAFSPPLPFGSAVSVTMTNTFEAV